MGLWGATDADEAKPKYLTDVEKRVVYATTKGWVKTAGGNDNTSADAEVLVAIGDLSGATKLNIADISSVNWNITAFDKSDGGTLSVTANYNEQVAVTGTPQLTVTNDTPARNLTLSYASGTGTNRLTFTLVVAAANAATNAGDVLSVGANAIALNSGTIKDGVVNATITHSALAASTNITVAA